MLRKKPIKTRKFSKAKTRPSQFNFFPTLIRTVRTPFPLIFLPASSQHAPTQKRPLNDALK